MKEVVVLSIVLACITTRSFGQASTVPPIEAPWKLGLGFYLSGSNLLLVSWQSPDLNAYGRSWRIEPIIGGSYSRTESYSTSTSASLTLGVGTQLRWRVRAPFNGLYFTMGPRAIVTGYYFGSIITERLSTSLGFLFGPEYSTNFWGQDFNVAGYASLTGTINGRSQSGSAWGLNIATGTGIILRYYFM